MTAAQPLARRASPSRQAAWRADPAGGRLPGGHRAEAVLGRGRGSTVWLARSPGGGRVALKTARRPVLAGLGRAPDFAAEFALAASLDHPNLLRALDHGVDGEIAWLAMEHCAGGDLARHPPAPHEAGALALEAAGALAALHRAGWVHRDLKPANLLRRADGSLALADFGSAAPQGAAGMPGLLSIGTPRYAAPEQTQGAPADPAADVYGLGLAIYEWLCGRPAHAGETPTELLCQHLLAQVPPLPARHAGWQPLLDAMLAKDAARRPADGAAVLHELTQLQPAWPPPAGGSAGA